MESNQITILLVDDDADARILVRDAILAARPSVEIFECSSGAEALKYLRACEPTGPRPRPDLIYLDLEMPGLSGIQMLQTVRADWNLRDIPIVMLTGVNDHGQQKKAAMAGANSYVLKPLSPMALLKTVRMTTEYWLNLHQMVKV